MIRVQNLKKSYGPVQALHDVSFDISRGEIVGFLGPNGAGKTTTMKILTGYLYPDTGHADIAGFDVVAKPLEVKKRTGYLPESTPLYTEMWVSEYLKFITDVREIPSEEKDAAISRVAGTCGLEKVMSKSIGELSKGFRQRVGLAQAMIHDPEVLILDEPTVGLDPNQIAEIRNLIRRLGEEKTVILSTHVMQEVQAVCQRVLIIHEGRVVKDSGVEELTSKGAAVELVWRASLADSEEALRFLPFPVSVVDKSEANGKSRLRLQLDGGEEACEEIFSLASRKNWKISELHREKTSLEEVFRSLTQGSKS